MNHPRMLLAMLAIVGCSRVPSARPAAQPVPPEVMEFLLTSAASDFHAHRPANLGPFRDVRIGHVKTPTGEDQYRMCGLYSPAAEPGTRGGTPFVTIKTSGYEQYLGAGASAAYCQDASIVWDSASDLMTRLQSRFDALERASP